MANRFKKHVIVVGSARSGTSWLSETLAQPLRYRMLFEPEQESQTKHGHLLCDKWLTEKQDSFEAFKYLTNVFKNSVDCDWIAQNSNRKFKRHLWPFVAKKYIIKFVRCNLAAHYMHAEFGIPVIHIIRNPYDVIRSQQQVRFPWLYDLTHFVEQEKLVQLIQEVYQYDITQYKNLSEVAILTLRWCIENVIPLEVFTPYSGKATVVRYEELSKNIDMFYELCTTYHLEPVPNLQKYFKQPSSKTHPEGAIYNKDAKKNALPEEVLLEINQILDVFKLTLYARRF
ncbi:sulfotransferase family protein [Lacinutrix sp. WUR7]|uniref:sulfotransferase family protein n=1 Tax=Lacinutrix sp. WUR7 TaxID=2653681 RepID=UPI00193C8776|nr:sulfotransferase family protein [Lacinutrix sp. WUR7]